MKKQPAIIICDKCNSKIPFDEPGEEEGDDPDFDPYEPIKIECPGCGDISWIATVKPVLVVGEEEEDYR